MPFAKTKLNRGFIRHLGAAAVVVIVGCAGVLDDDGAPDWNLRLS